ncbi:hypothetical protein GOP47_0024016 [Adiantum capillus-veneris]|uniref:BZIP domain-containing protein n=1 Tax=Adiantum capillus-veneris TaxID=13818 RepID=A0A9D4Z6H6_ADICA|nr:hypothetical protein GOP47_0024016 [Adiantum capillus-veneris]
MQVASSSSSLSPKDPLFNHLLDHGEYSDLDVGEVPDMAGKVPNTSAAASVSHRSGRKKRSLPAEKENSRMKRLLRNRVSAQQARERKKAYLTDLETRIKEIEHQHAELEEKVSTLQQENSMLRKIIRSTSIRTDGVKGIG